MSWNNLIQFVTFFFTSFRLNCYFNNILHVLLNKPSVLLLSLDSWLKLGWLWLVICDQSKIVFQLSFPHTYCVYKYTGMQSKLWHVHLVSYNIFKFKLGVTKMAKAMRSINLHLWFTDNQKIGWYNYNMTHYTDT